MSEELKKLREATEVRCALLDNEKWASRPDVFVLPYEAELPNSNNLEYNDKYINTIPTNRGFDQLRGMVLYLQSKLNEHIDKKKPDKYTIK